MAQRFCERVEVCPDIAQHIARPANAGRRMPLPCLPPTIATDATMVRLQLKQAAPVSAGYRNHGTENRGKDSDTAYGYRKSG